MNNKLITVKSERMINWLIYNGFNIIDEKFDLKHLGRICTFNNTSELNEAISKYDAYRKTLHIKDDFDEEMEELD